MHSLRIECETEFRLGHFKKVISLFNKVLEVTPNDANALVNRGLAQASLGNHEVAIADYNKALLLNPVSLNLYYNRGISHFEMRCFEVAILDFTEAITISQGTLPDIFSWRGLCNVELHNYAKAIQDHTVAICTRPFLAGLFSKQGPCSPESWEFSRVRF